MFKNLIGKFGKTFAYVAVGSIFSGVANAAGMLHPPSDPLLGFLYNTAVTGLTTAATAVATRVAQWDPSKIVK